MVRNLVFVIALVASAALTTATTVEAAMSVDSLGESFARLNSVEKRGSFGTVTTMLVRQWLARAGLAFVRLRLDPRT